MPTPTYVAIAKTVLTGSQAVITFSSIPSTYTDLVVLCSPRSTTVSSSIENFRIRPNNSTSLVYSAIILYHNGSTVSNTSTSGNNNIGGYGTPGASTTSNTFGSVEIYLPNYAGSTNKVLSVTSIGENNSATTSFIGAITAGLFSDTTAISSLTLTATSNDFASGSRFDLYGIKNS